MGQKTFNKSSFNHADLIGGLFMTTLQRFFLNQ